MAKRPARSEVLFGKAQFFKKHLFVQNLQNRILSNVYAVPHLCPHCTVLDSFCPQPLAAALFLNVLQLPAAAIY